MKQTLELIRRLYLGPGPVYLIQYVTSRCNLRCRHCFYMPQILSGRKQELSLEEFERIAANLPRLVQLSIGGGEPLLREDLAEIIRIYRKVSGVSYFTLPTNATLPERTERLLNEVLPSIRPAHLRLSLSLDGVGEEHDRIRGVQGTFDRFKETWERVAPLRKRFDNLSIDIVACISALNQDRIGPLYDYCRQHFPADNLGLLYVRGNVDPEIKRGFLDQYGELAARLERDNRAVRENRSRSGLFRALASEVHSLVRRTVEQDRWLVPCEAGRRLLVISEEGKVYPCEMLDDCYGSLREHDYDLQSIMRQPEVRRRVAGIRQDRCFCTWECIHSLNGIYHRRGRIALRAARSLLRRGPVPPDRKTKSAPGV